LEYGKEEFVKNITEPAFGKIKIDIKN